VPDKIDQLLATATAEQASRLDAEQQQRDREAACPMHDFTFLRYFTRYPAAFPGDPSYVVDVFYCRRCLTQREVRAAMG
jgi:hypothetical protein